MFTKRTILMSLVIILAMGPIVHAQMNDLTDKDIRNAVEEELLFDRAVPSNDIDVIVVNGVVTLEGTANNILAKERAARIAQTVRGVRSVTNQINVEPIWDITDEELQNDVKSALMYDRATESWKIDVSASNGNVTLAGNVESWQEKELAGMVAKGVRGVQDVTNNINVEFAADRSDADIKADIEGALRWDALVDDGLIEVEVNDGQVTLTGIVGSSSEKSQAYADAWVSGVTTIDDSGLRVERWARDQELRGKKYGEKSDEEIADAVNDALLYDPRVLSFKITPEVNMGVVTLRGTVDNVKAKRVAADIARNTVGVVSVRNRINVRTDSVTNEEIRNRVVQGIERDPYLNRYDVNVTVVDGTVYLTGTVTSYFEKGQAEDIASRVGGVDEIVNNLVVSDSQYPLAYDPYVYGYYPYDYTWYDYTPYYTYRTDEDIKDFIETQFFWSPFVDGGDINLNVDSGEVTMTGNVDSWFERYKATENAYEGGATWVNNKLEVLEEQ